MRFGGHETFPIRDGWLYKGLRLAIENPGAYERGRTQDYLGVGKNMARAIKHWLVATGLAEHAEEKVTRWTPPRVTPLGHLIFARDPHFEFRGTWWALHVNMVNNEAHAASWHWFFNYFNVQRFEKPVCVEGITRHLQHAQTRMPSARTLDRDISCLLATYATVIPRPMRDPEDLRDCPFIDLGLLTHFRESGYYHVNHARKDIAPQLLGYAIATSEDLNRRIHGAHGNVRVLDTVQAIGGPGRCFLLGGEELLSLVQEQEHAPGSLGIGVAGLAGERALSVPRATSLEWLSDYYDTQMQETRNVG
ncbi:MAG: DUF4007 family protein [bacterium]|nr:DUF4007 family protein [bacterium]